MYSFWRTGSAVDVLVASPRIQKESYKKQVIMFLKQTITANCEIFFVYIETEKTHAI